MPDMNWIKLNRKIWDSFIWSFENPKYTLAWIDMLLMANYKDKQIRCRGTVETVRRGLPPSRYHGHEKARKS